MTKSKESLQKSQNTVGEKNQNYIYVMTIPEGEEKEQDAE